MNKASVTISIPAFNEEGSLRELVHETEAVLEASWANHEILIINDGSSDQTGAIADELASKNKRIRVLHHKKNLGFGTTLKEIYKEPKTDWVFMIPGDGQIRPDELHKLWPFTDQYDFILGHRVNRIDPWFRGFTSWVYNVMISLIMGRRIYDVDSVGLVRRELLDKIDLQSESVFLHAEVCLKAVIFGGRLIETPIQHQARRTGTASGNRIPVIIKTFSEYLSFAFCRKSWLK